MSKVYECGNQACSLGTVGNPGRFTGGISKEGAFVLTGNQDAEHGPGYCPNCGKKGKAI